MTDELWLDVAELKPMRLGKDAPQGLYLSPDLGFKRIWVAGDEEKLCIYPDHEFEIGGFEGSSALFLGPVRLVVNPRGFQSPLARGFGAPGTLILERRKIFVAGRTSRQHWGGRRAEVGQLTEEGDYPYPITCRKWGLVMLDFDNELRPALEVDLPAEA